MTAQMPISTDAQRARLTARDFWTLAEAGAFEGFKKTELIEGEIWVVNAVYSWHAKTVARSSFELRLALREIGSDLEVYADGSINLANDTVPQPDVSVGEDHDGPGIPLAKMRIGIEVADTSAKNDRSFKARLYAGGGLPEYWVIDRKAGCVAQMWSPGGEGYGESREVAFGDSIESVTVERLVMSTEWLVERHP